jgi:hypothetical protein
MIRVALAIAVLAFTTATIGLPAGTADAQTVKRIPGVLDPTTGVFTTVPMTVPAASSTISGTVKVVLNLTLDSAIGSDETITCTVSISTYDTSYINSASAAIDAVRSGRKATCTLVIPYEWTVAKAGETVSITLGAGAGGSGVGIDRAFGRTLAAFNLPTKNGVTKTFVATGTM